MFRSVTVKLPDVATIVRAVPGTVYNPGTRIALSATRGQVEYRREEGEEDSRWAVIEPSVQCQPYYLYLAIEASFPEFLHKFKTGINLQIGALDEIELTWHTELEDQLFIVNLLAQCNHAIESVSNEIEIEKKAKSYFLSGMFPE